MHFAQETFRDDFSPRFADVLLPYLGAYAKRLICLLRKPDDNFFELDAHLTAFAPLTFSLPSVSTCTRYCTDSGTPLRRQFEIV